MSPIETLKKEAEKFYKNEERKITLEELQLEKRELEGELSKRITEFEQKYKIEVQDLEIFNNSFRLISGECYRDKEIKIEIKL